MLRRSGVFLTRRTVAGAADQFTPFFGRKRSGEERCPKTTSKWRWADCDPFVTLKHTPNLGLPRVTAAKLLPAQKVFAALPTIDPDDFVDYDSDYKKLVDLDAIDEKVFDDDFRERGVTSKAKRREYYNVQVSYEAYNLNDNLLDSLRLALMQERKLEEDKRSKKRYIDLCTERLARVCGFDKIAVKPGRMDFAGCDVANQPDVYVAMSSSREVLLIFYDRIALRDQIAMGPIFGEMLMLHYHNCIKYKLPAPPKSVYCLRVHYTRASLFALDATASQVQAICVDRRVPTRKMVLRSSAENPTQNEGLDLLDQGQRLDLMVQMASLREHLTSPR